MTDFDKSLERANKISESVKEKRRREWETIQRETPDIAELLTQINKIYGKPEAVLIKSGNRIIFTKGILLPELILRYTPKHNQENRSKAVKFDTKTSRHQTKTKK